MKRLGEPSEYRLRYFANNGYSRRICSSCGTPFWSRGEHERCNDLPCTEYRFFDIPVRLRGLSYEDALRIFTSFFEKEGHKLLEPAPVVARWREDLYLTIASIVVFQPHVTSGRVPPPANPLVIAQPCIRLDDIDNVGRTFGRHMTNFTMGGHHAFNSKEKWLYWKDETVEYARRFFTELIGVPDEELTFKESWWEGGGNSGPSLEVTVGGLEVATLVFMQYEVTDKGLVELPLKIVDTGYGIERIAWLSQKTPTAFHAVYGEDLVSTYHRMLGVGEPDRGFLEQATRISGSLDPEDPGSLEKLSKELSSRTGLGFREAQELLAGAVGVYSILDHVKTLILMLGDGVVPSNSGEGYLARLVARRALRTLRRLGSGATLEELAVPQIDRWGRVYPRVGRNAHYILQALKIEEERFLDVMRRAPSVVARYSRGGISLEDLVEIYDSHGIPPELVEEEASKRGLPVSIPHNFYSIVASRHMRSPTREDKIDKDIVEWASKLPPTRRIFHEDPYARNFRARIVGVRGDLVILDATAFYPTGGGQVHDTGVITVRGRDLKVLEVFKVGDVVIHRVEGELGAASAGEPLEGRIDWSRRYRIMRHHTATHALLGALRRLYGDHVWQAGAEKTEAKGRLDVTHYAAPSREEISRLEAMVNSLIDDRRPVRAQIVERYEAERRHGLSIYQGGVPQESLLRIVEIDSWDAEACFGTHVSNTGEIGGFKIISAGKIADGVVRFEYVASTRASERLSEVEGVVESIARILEAQADQGLVRRVEGLAGQLEESQRILSSYRSEWVATRVREAEERYEAVGRARLYIMVNPVESEGGREVLRILSSRPGYVAAFITSSGDESLFEISVSEDLRSVAAARSVVQELVEALGGKGGGRDSHATARLRSRPEDVVRTVRDVLRKRL